MRDIIDARMKSARTSFGAASAALGDSAVFACGMQLPAPAVAAASRAADLIVAGGAPRKLHDPYMHCAPAELAITSGRPVLVAPPAAPPLVAKQVLLAWKDTREARRAMSDAMPFFEQAERVVVAAVCPDTGTEQALHELDDVVRALTRRGVNAEARVAQEKHPEGFHILRQASLDGADLIVCGAYGHTRLGEWVFGGVTADLLAQDSAYLLLSVTEDAIMSRLENKVALVTGAALGLGRAIAMRMAQEGAAVAILDLHDVGESSRTTCRRRAARPASGAAT